MESMDVMLASGSFLDHVMDHPWPGCQWFDGAVTWMSSGIFSIYLAGLVLLILIPWMARRREQMPIGSQNALEVLVVFVRDMIARPALHERAYEYLPLLLTMFVFVLGMNLMGLIPLSVISALLIEPNYPGFQIGATPTLIVTVCAALGSLALLTIIAAGLRRTAEQYHHKRDWPLPLAIALSPVLWVLGLSPSLPGAIGTVFVLPLALLELVGAAAKCFSLMVRLFANILAGHLILAALLMLVGMAAVSHHEQGTGHVWYVTPVVSLASMGFYALELLVAALQAYIFTFLTAMFLGLYAEASH